MDSQEEQQTEAQARYARFLDWGTRAGFVILVLSFVVYAFGFTSPLVPPERLPQLWSQPVAQYLAATGAPTGWSWVGLLRHGDVAALLGIVVLATCSAFCLLALLPVYWRRGDRAYFALALAELAVIALAASSWLTAG